MDTEKRRPLIFAHRGASAYAPENTLEAFALAAKMGADGVELDVRLSRDGEPMVIHDEEIVRVSNGLGLVRNMTCAELKKLRFNRTHPEYKDAQIPTLREVYDLLKPTGMIINTEFKGTRISDDALEQKCLWLAEEMGMADRVLYSCFNHYSLMRVKRHDRALRTGLLRLPLERRDREHLIDPWQLASSMGIDAIHPHFSQLQIPGQLEKAHAMGLAVNTWTVDTEADIRASLLAGADGIIGDRPDLMVKVRHELEEANS